MTTRLLTALSVAAMALIVTLPASAQDAGPTIILPGAPPSAPKDSAPKDGAPKHNADEPPPLNLGGDTRPDAVANASKETRALWSSYARTMHRALDAALLANAKTSRASLRVGFELWVDGKGKVMRVRLTRPSGDPTVDAAVRDEIAPGLALPAPPPDMPLPVIVNLAQ